MRPGTHPPGERRRGPSRSRATRTRAAEIDWAATDGTASPAATCCPTGATRRSRRDSTRAPRRRMEVPRSPNNRHPSLSCSEERTPPVLAEHLPHRPADLADRRPLPQRVLDRVEQIALAPCDLLELAEPRLDRRAVTSLLEARKPLQLAALRFRVHPEDLDVVDLVGHELVDADDDVLPGAVPLVVGGGRLLDLPLNELQRPHRPAELLHLVDQLPGAR